VSRRAPMDLDPRTSRRRAMGKTEPATRPPHPGACHRDGPVPHHERASCHGRVRGRRPRTPIAGSRYTPVAVGHSGRARVTAVLGAPIRPRPTRPAPLC
jgi:hypothetical protein